MSGRSWPTRSVVVGHLIRRCGALVVLIPLVLIGLTASAAASGARASAASPALDLPSPSLPVTALPTSLPSLPVTVPTAPTLPLPTPTAIPSPTATASPTPGSPAGAGLTSSSGPPGSSITTRPESVSVGSGRPVGDGANGIVIPSVTLPGGALGIGVLVAIASLPFLLGVGLLLLGRVWGETRRLRNVRLRMALAAELDLKPRELAHLNTQKLMRLRDQIAFDELTGVLRRVAGIASLDREIARARRLKTTLVAAFIDLDGLKRVNDSRGHAAGDSLIRGVAQLLQRGLRRDDLLFRYGGDEFVCVLPGSTLDGCEAKLRELRARAVKNSMSFSFGVTELGDRDDLVSFLGRADQFLYNQRSKREQELTGVAVVLPLGGRTDATQRTARARRAE